MKRLLLLAALLLCGVCVAYEDPRERAAREAVNGRSDDEPAGVSAKLGRGEVNADWIARERGSHRGSGTVTLSSNEFYKSRNEKRAITNANSGFTSIAGANGSRHREEAIDNQNRRCVVEKNAIERRGDTECSRLRQMKRDNGEDTSAEDLLARQENRVREFIPAPQPAQPQPPQGPTLQRIRPQAFDGQPVTDRNGSTYTPNAIGQLRNDVTGQRCRAKPNGVLVCN